MDETNVGKWDRWNQGAMNSYGDPTTGAKAAEFLKDCSLVEDWGCGRGFMRNLLGPERWRGVDGSPNREGGLDIFSADLTQYHSSVPGIVIRHVLEHNHKWERILYNLCASFREVLVIILFTPWADGPTKDLAPGDHPEIDVPDYSFNREEFMGLIEFNISLRGRANFDIQTVENLKTRTQFDVEHMIVVKHL